MGGLPWAAWAALGPLVLACWTKQSTVAALGAGGLYLLARDWRSGLRWCVVAGVALLGPFLVLNLALGGQLGAHLFAPSAETLSADRLTKNLGALWGEQWPLVVGGTLAGAGLLLTAVRTRRAPALSAWYGLVSVPPLVLTNLSPHANYNHLLDGLLPLCLLLGVGLGHLAAWAREAAPVRLLPLAAAVALVLVQPTLFTPLHTWYTPLGQPLAEKADRYARLEAAIAATPSSAVLSEDAWLALRAGKSLPYDDPAQMATQAAAGQWDDSLLLADIARRKFPLVILEHDITDETLTPRWTPAALAALQANYTAKFRDVRFLDVPRPPPVTPPDLRACSLAGGPRLVGVFLPGGGARLDAGDQQAISLYWAAPTPGSAPAAGLKFSLRLLDAGGVVAWQADLPPGAAAGTPWPAWPPGAAPRDDLQVLAPATAAPGAYTLALSAYVAAPGGLRPAPLTCTGSPAAPTLVLARPQVARPWQP